jgi:hypothetical protein
MLFQCLAIIAAADFVQHQRQARQRGEEHFALPDIALEQFTLDVGIH